ncbi:MAG: acetyl-CoA carboxylase biotin carboxyl carrier protein subunit [Microthrixaceae bacterium]
MVNPLVESDGSGGARFQVVSPLVGTVVAIHISDGAHVRAGMPVVTIESMKMEHPVTAQASGRVTALHVIGR